MNVLVISAHPDDEVLGCGATIAKHVNNKDKVYVVIVADGATARYKDNMISLLKDSCHKSNKLLGVKQVFFLGFKDQYLDSVPLIEIIKSIETIKSKVKPDVVYTHSYTDLNKDHQVVNKATLTAFRPVDKQKVQIYSYEVNSSTEWNPSDVFRPNIYIDITNFISKKIKAFECYKSEIRDYPHPRSKEAIIALAKYRGFQSALKYAESFHLIRGYK